MAEQNANAVAITGGTAIFTSVTTPSVTASTTDLTLSAISTGAVKFSTLGGLQAQVSNVDLAVNYLQFTGSPTTKAVEIDALGTDTNISMAFQPKGTGAINLAAGSRGVNISNGGTVTAITVTNVGATAYSSIPTATVSVPTTAGGVQATTTVAMRASTGATTLADGGTGYTVGNVLTVVGGVFTSAATITVTAVSAGVITAFTVSQAGAGYTTLPTNPASVTGGSGSGATFNLAWFVNTIAIATAGSGYTEQPTVTFSGGGGSGAAAYAVVGSIPTVKSIGSSMSFATAGGEQFRVIDSAGTAINRVDIGGTSVVGGTVVVAANGASGNINLGLRANGAGNIIFGTAAGSATQLSVSHTASAVNFVQVTGGATGTTVQVTAQGSDAAVGLQFVAKTASIVFVTRSGNARSFNIADSASPVNYLQVQGNTAGVAPILSAQGTDTDIDLTLTPKGAGNVRFGTYTGTVLVPTGFIEIKDSGGTTRRLLVG
jgi:hypothetical protein